MGLKTGLNSQLGYGEESPWGIPVTVTRFLPVMGDPTLEQKIEWMEDDGIVAGRRTTRADGMVQGRITVGGSIPHRLYDHSMVMLFKHALGPGGYSVSGPGPYTHTCTPGDLTGYGMTIQRGIPDTGTGTVRPYTYAGCKVGKWEMAWKEGEIATWGAEWMGRWECRHRTVSDGVTTSGSPTVTSATAVFTQDDVGKPISGTGIPANSYIGVRNSATSVGLSSTSDSNTPVNASASGTSIAFTIGIALASASYASNLIPVRFRDVTLSIAGTATKVKELSIAGDNGLEERRFDGTPYTDEPLEADERQYTGKCLPEFTSNTAYERWVNGTQAAIVATTTVGSNTITVTMNAIFDGEPPKQNGTKVVDQPLSFKCVGSTDAAAITLVAVNSDSTA